VADFIPQLRVQKQKKLSATGDFVPRPPDHGFSPWTPLTAVTGINVNNVFYYGHVFIYFPKVFFIFKKTLAKFGAASRLTRSTFKITATKQTYDFSVAYRILLA